MRGPAEETAEAAEAPAMAPALSRAPWRAVAVVLAIMVLTLLAFPAGVVDWMGDHCEEGRICDALVAAATAVDDLSRHFKVEPLFERARDDARRDLGIDEY